MQIAASALHSGNGHYRSAFLICDGGTLWVVRVLNKWMYKHHKVHTPNTFYSMCCMLLILDICKIMVNACVSILVLTQHGYPWYVRGGCWWRGAEEVTEQYQLTFPFTPNSDRLKCSEHVWRRMLSSMHVCFKYGPYGGGILPRLLRVEYCSVHQCRLSSAWCICEMFKSLWSQKYWEKSLSA